MSALAEHPSTASISASATVVIGETEATDLLVEEPIDFDALAPALLNAPVADDADYPPGTGPFGF